MGSVLYCWMAVERDAEPKETLRLRQSPQAIENITPTTLTLVSRSQLAHPLHLLAIKPSLSTRPNHPQYGETIEPTRPKHINSYQTNARTARGLFAPASLIYGDLLQYRAHKYATLQAGPTDFGLSAGPSLTSFQCVRLALAPSPVQPCIDVASFPLSSQLGSKVAEPPLLYSLNYISAETLRFETPKDTTRRAHACLAQDSRMERHTTML